MNEPLDQNSTAKPEPLSRVHAMTCLVGLALGWGVLVAILSAQLISIDPPLNELTLRFIEQGAAEGQDRDGVNTRDALAQVIFKEELQRTQKRVVMFMFLLALSTVCAWSVGCVILRIAREAHTYPRISQAQGARPRDVVQTVPKSQPPPA